MPPVLQLPLEVIYSITKCLDGPADVSAWSRSCRAFHTALAPLLYYNAKDDISVMCWACDEGRLGTVQRLLEAGASPNAAWTQRRPRAWTLEALHPRPRVAPTPTQATTHLLPAVRGLEEQGDKKEEEEEEEEEEEKVAPASTKDAESRLSDWLSTHVAVRYKASKYIKMDLYYQLDSDKRPAYVCGCGSECEGRCSLARKKPYNSVGTFPERAYWSPLHIAAAAGHDQLVTLLLDSGADINALSREFCLCAVPPKRGEVPLWTPLHTAMCHSHESTTRLLLSRGASTNVTTPYEGCQTRRFTALHSACALDLLDAARALVDGGHLTDVSIPDHCGMTPFAHAFLRGNWAIIDFLVEHGADVNERIGSFPALEHACLLGYYAEAVRLIDLGATCFCAGTPTCFHLMAVAAAPDCPSTRSIDQREHRLELVDRLIKLGVDVNQRGLKGSTVLAEAAAFHRVAEVEALLQSGADVRAKDHAFKGFSALRMAVSQYSNESRMTPKGSMLNTVRALLTAMAETPAPRLVDIGAVVLNMKESDTTDDHDIGNAFRVVCSQPQKHKDKLEVAALLSGYNRAIEIAKAGPNLVHASMLARNYGITSLLLESGFDQPSEKQFAQLIQHFLKNDTAEGLRYILNRFSHIVPQIRNEQLLSNAVKMGSRKCAALLIKEGVPITGQTKAGRSLMADICVTGDVRMAKIFLENGADPDERSQEGDLLTVIAADCGNMEMLQLLLDYGASIHSSPPRKSTRYPNGMGLFDFALCRNKQGAMRVILGHRNSGSHTDEELSRHWRLMVDKASPEMVHIVLTLGSFDLNHIFTIERYGHAMRTTLVHMLCDPDLCPRKRNALLYGRISFRANAHRLLPTGDISESQNEAQAPRKFEGTTPLEWAIEFSSSDAVRQFSDCIAEDLCDSQPEETDTQKRDLLLRYARAACRGLKPDTLELLFALGFSRAVHDEAGNTIIHMICDAAESQCSDAKNERMVRSIAQRSAHCIVKCLRAGVTPQTKNREGVSATDRVLRIRNYHGVGAFRRNLAKQWRMAIDHVADPSPRLVPNAKSGFSGSDRAHFMEALVREMGRPTVLHSDDDEVSEEGGIAAWELGVPGIGFSDEEGDWDWPNDDELLSDELSDEEETEWPSEEEEEEEEDLFDDRYD
ncbi:ankyrin repeat-containing domain protein [Nemania sp. FL0916]|nr:ankyrin repeat-containing domain protein [Nemania sp. FL0916]